MVSVRPDIHGEGCAGVGIGWQPPQNHDLELQWGKSRDQLTGLQARCQRHDAVIRRSEEKIQVRGIVQS